MRLYRTATATSVQYFVGRVSDNADFLVRVPRSVHLSGQRFLVSEGSFVMVHAAYSLVVLVMCGADPQTASATTNPPAVEKFLKSMEAHRVSELRRLSERVKELQVPSPDKAKRRRQKTELREAKRLIRQLESAAGKPLPPRGKDGRWQLPKLHPHRFKGGRIGVFAPQEMTFKVFQIFGADEFLVRFKFAVKQPEDEDAVPQKKLGTDPVIRDVFLIQGIPTKGLREKDAIDLSDKVFQVLGVKNHATGVPGARVVSSVEVFDMKPITAWLAGRRTVVEKQSGGDPKPKKKASEPKTVAEKKPSKKAESPSKPLSKEDLEKRAAFKLKLALKFLEKKPKIAKRRLKKIREGFPDTRAAKEAADYLKKLGG